MRKHILVSILIVVLINSSYSVENKTSPKLHSFDPPQQSDDGWQTTTLRNANIDSAKLQIMVNKIRQNIYQNINSVLIIKEGKLVSSQSNNVG